MNLNQKFTWIISISESYARERNEKYEEHGFRMLCVEFERKN